MDAAGIPDLLQVVAEVHFKMLELGYLQGRPAWQAALLFFGFSTVVPASVGHSVSNVSDQQYAYLYPQAPAFAGSSAAGAVPASYVAFIDCARADECGRLPKKEHDPVLYNLLYFGGYHGRTCLQRRDCGYIIEDITV